ncbi:MAG: hypothetical protein KDB61_03415 [Planctomycetes bacterium]|nr:hypothetical protein [Planctomycetota bacterium]
MVGLRRFLIGFGLYTLSWGVGLASQDVSGEAPAESGEFWVRSVALDPEGTRAEWIARLDSEGWLDVYDVFDAMQRCPEAAAWFCQHEPQALAKGVNHPRSSVRAAAWRVLGMGQGAGPLAVDYSAPSGRGEDWRSWREAALSHAGLGDSSAFQALWLDWSVSEEVLRRHSWRGRLAMVSRACGGESAGLWMAEGGGIADLRPLDLRLLLRPEDVETLRRRVRDANAWDRFRVEGLALAQSMGLEIGRSDVAPIDWRVLEEGLVQVPSDDAAFDEWSTFVAELTRLGSPKLAEVLWDVALQVDSKLSSEAIEALGGPESATAHYLFLSVQCAPPAASLERARALNRALQEQVWAALEGDWRTVEVRSLEPWIVGDFGPEITEWAVSRLCEAPASAERAALLISAVESASGEALRLAFRALAAGEAAPEIGDTLHRIWRDQDAVTRDALMRELPRASHWTAFQDDWLEELRELGPCDLLVLEHLVVLPRAERWQTWVERDFREAWTARFAEWRAGEEPVSRDLARRGAALMRVLPPDGELTEHLAFRGLLERVAWLQSMDPEKLEAARFDYSKACIAALAKDARFVEWVAGHLDGIRTWPRRLRVEVALQDLAFDDADRKRAWMDFVHAIGESDYPQLGAVLRERWLSDPLRAGSWLQVEARNRRATPNLRQIAMAGLAASGDVQTLLEILREDHGVTGPQLALESLVSLGSPDLDPALRERWLLARERASQGEADGEIEGHLAMELMGALVKRGALDPAELSSVLDGPMAARWSQWEQRLAGAPTSENWGAERQVMALLAQSGELATLLELNPRWCELDGRFLLHLAQVAWAAQDQESAGILARWAEVALAGEPATGEWEQADLGVRLLRFQLAQAGEQWGAVAWYCEGFVADLLESGSPPAGLARAFGDFDLREGRHPLARLCALRLQSLAMGSAARGDAARARELLELAEPYSWTSKRARSQQERALRWVQNR